MLNLKECTNIFNKYIKNFDFKNKNIARKFHHTYRVVEHSKDIAESLNLSKNDVELAQVCALFHDIGRFIQWKEYNTFIDAKSFDHGDKGEEIVREFIDEISDSEEEKNIILKSIKNHNKSSIESGLNERCILFCNIVRDADKLDIMMEQAYSITDDYYELNKDILDCIYNKKLVKNKLVEHSIDHVLRCISFIFDINYKYSLNVIKTNIINKKIDLLKANVQDKELLELEKFIFEYVDERMMELC